MSKLTFLFYLIFLSPNIVTGNSVEIYSLDQLDDQRGFCIDIRGHKSKAEINSGLQAHTCYSYQGTIAVDQGKSKKGGGGSPVHLTRNLSMELCSDTPQAFQMWGARSEP